MSQESPPPQQPSLADWFSRVPYDPLSSAEITIAATSGLSATRLLLVRVVLRFLGERCRCQEKLQTQHKGRRDFLNACDFYSPYWKDIASHQCTHTDARYERTKCLSQALRRQISRLVGLTAIT
jgi:hypothetical protein